MRDRKDVSADGPRLFDPDKVEIEYEDSGFHTIAGEPEHDPEIETGATRRHDSGGGQVPNAGIPVGPRGLFDRRPGWGSVFFSALVSLALMALGIWATDYVTALMGRQDWLGWLALGLLTVMGVAALAIALREIGSIWRLKRLKTIRDHADAAWGQDDAQSARKAIRELSQLYRGRADMERALAVMGAHGSGVYGGRELMELTDQELATALDGPARTIVADTAKRVALLTALSPNVLLDVALVTGLTMSMLRQLSELYGGRPGFFGLLRLARRVISHIVLTGGVAVTVDLAQDILGKHFAKMVAGRLGEGVFNGALTARLGVAAVEVIRPVPYVAAKPPGVGNIIWEIAGSLRKQASDRAEPAEPTRDGARES